ncbi:sialic acid-binding Ig-like lectin 15 [Chelonoidis abingdonii]|uniref:sialic acid-binding Ig-like lectin 15 n=1 Tax=Chelonoidis abingdonii TaxID=106734 RepID=UPI003F49324F
MVDKGRQSKKQELEDKRSQPSRNSARENTPGPGKTAKGSGQPHGPVRAHLQEAPGGIPVGAHGQVGGGMLRGGWAQSGWDMYVPPQIMGLRGDSIVLPCNFTHPKPNYTGDIQVIWKPDIFQCLVSNSSTKTRSFDNCTTGQGPSGRYRLAGDPQRHNLSLHITGLRYEDSKGYMCRVVLRQNPAWAYENKMAIMLSVEARPSILNLTLLPGPLPVQVACTAEGNPVPNITWLGLAGSEVGQLQNTTGPQYQTTQVLSVSRIGTYTCRAENVHGQAERSVLVGPMGPPLLLIILLPAALLLLAGLLLLVLCCRWKDC